MTDTGVTKRDAQELKYMVEASNGWNSVWERPVDDPRWGTRLHYLKTARLAEEIAASLNNAFELGAAYGHRRGVRAVIERIEAEDTALGDLDTVHKALALLRRELLGEDV